MTAALRKTCEVEGAERQSHHEVEVSSGMCVLYVPPRAGHWAVGLLLTVWRFTAKRQKRGGARPVTLPIPKQVTRYVRIVQMKEHGPVAGVFRCGAASMTHVCDVERIGIFLKTTSEMSGVDGFQVKLTDRSWEAVQKAHVFDQWPAHLKNCSDFRSARPGVQGRQKQVKRKAGKPNAINVPDTSVTILDDDDDDDAEGQGVDPKTKDCKKLLKSLKAKATEAVEPSSSGAKKQKKDEEIPATCPV